jgi:hypothetical protein
VGKESKQVPAGSPTLNLQGMDKGVFTEKDDGIVLHEFGHAIGFHHEHQSPASVCENEFDWDHLYKKMGSWGWNRQTVDHNMRQLEPSTRLSTTSFDPESVMLYNLSRDSFKSDLVTLNCYIPEPNNAISKTDREAAAAVYPVAVSLRQSLRRSLKLPKTRDAAVTKAIKRLKELTDAR